MANDMKKWLSRESMTPEQRKKADALSNFITKWSLASEVERGNNLPSYEDVNESFIDSDIDKLHDQALKLRVALSEIDSGVLSHIRNIISLAREMYKYDEEDKHDEADVPEFLKAVPIELRENAIQEIIMSEVAGIAMRMMVFDLDHSVEQ